MQGQNPRVSWIELIHLGLVPVLVRTDCLVPKRLRPSDAWTEGPESWGTDE